MYENSINSRIAFPSDADYLARIQRTQFAMGQAGVDVLALSGADFRNFLTGLSGLPVGRPIWLVLRRDGNPAFVSPRSEAKEIRARCRTPVAVEWVEWEEAEPAPTTHQAALAQHLENVAYRARSIGVDFNSTWASNLELVKQALGAERIQDVTAMLQDVWACKDTPGIAAIRNSCDIAAHQFQAGRQVIAPGVAEWRVALASIEAAMERGAELLGGDEERSPIPHALHMMGSGAGRTARCHSAGGGRLMREGETMQLCLCGQAFCGQGRCFDRPVLVGSKALSPEVQKIVDIAREAQEAALAKIRPGVTAGEVHSAAVDVIERGGWHRPFLHRTGRGIGYSDWDGVELKAGEGTRLKEGMVLSVEPGVYVDGVGGARFGDTVLVTETGYEVLTPFELGRVVG